MSEQHDKTDAQNNPEATPIDDNQTQTQESVTIDIDSASVETLSPEQTRIFELENELANSFSNSKIRVCSGLSVSTLAESISIVTDS